MDALRHGRRTFLPGGHVADAMLSGGGLRGVFWSSRMRPRMAQRAASSLFVMAVGLVSFTGCAERPVVEQLPAANFNGPLTPPPPVVVPEPVKVVPKVAVVEPKKVTRAPVAAAPAEWTP